MIPTPVRNDRTTDYNTSTPQFEKWIAETQSVQADLTGFQSWWSTEKDRYQKIYQEYWTLFQQKSPAQKAERTLRPQDGMLGAELDH
jgi:hypothetical protein